MTNPQDIVVVYKDNKIKKHGYTVSDHFFDVFTWKTVNGNPKSIFQTPNSIVLSKSASESIFGTSDPIDKIIRIPGNRDDVKVFAVVEDAHENSTIKFDYI